MDPALGNSSPPLQRLQQVKLHSGAELFKRDEHDREPPACKPAMHVGRCPPHLFSPQQETCSVLQRSLSLRSHFVCSSLRKKERKKKKGETRRKGTTPADVKLGPRDTETERADPHAARHQKRARARSREKKGPGNINTEFLSC